MPNKRPPKAAKSASASKTQNNTARPTPRTVDLPKRYWYRPLTWRHRAPVPAYAPLSKARHIFMRSLRLLWAHKKLYGGIVAIYGLLNLLLVRGLAGSADLSAFQQLIRGDGTGVGVQLQSSATTFLYLLGTSGSANSELSSLYQTVLVVVSSLALIWAIRQIVASHTVTTRDSFYQGMYPLIPYVLTMLLLGLQLIPLALSGFLYSTIITGGIAVHVWEQALWILICGGLAVWSLRMITATIFATYIVTLPDMIPLRAYRSARTLVYGRRLLIWRKLIFLPVALLLVATIVELPLIIFAAPVAEWAFFVLTMAALPIVHSYIYSLYRELL